MKGKLRMAFKVSDATLPPTAASCHLSGSRIVPTGASVGREWETIDECWDVSHFFFFHAVDSTCSHNCMEFLVLGWAKHCWRSSEHELKLPSPFMERGFQGEKTPKLKISQGQYMMMFLIFSYMKAYSIFWKSPCRDQPPHCWQQFSHTKNC